MAKSEKSFLIATENTNKSVTGNGETPSYEIICPRQDDLYGYVNGLNFISQLVKCKFYAFKTGDKNKD